MPPRNRNQWLYTPIFIDDSVQTQYNGNYDDEVILDDLIDIINERVGWTFKDFEDGSNVVNLDEESVDISEEEFKNLLKGN